MHKIKILLQSARKSGTFNIFLPKNSVGNIHRDKGVNTIQNDINILSTVLLFIKTLR